MISRRRFLFLLGLLGVSTRWTLSDSIAVASPPPAKSEGPLPPHCEALSQVWNTQNELIKAVELQYAKSEQGKRKEYVSPESRWWFDAEGRNWEIARPFEPGGVDSTHMFTVRYLINGKAVAAWSVDTRKKEVSVIK